MTTYADRLSDTSSSEPGSALVKGVAGIGPAGGNPPAALLCCLSELPPKHGAVFGDSRQVGFRQAGYSEKKHNLKCQQTERQKNARKFAANLLASDVTPDVI